MGCTHCRSGVFASITRAMAKSAAATLRRAHALPVYRDWSLRATICETCPVRVIHGKISYCGRPFLEQIDRDPAETGCGCPTRDKAKSPAEHCPIDARHRPARVIDGQCNCKWCAR